MPLPLYSCLTSRTDSQATSKFLTTTPFIFRKIDAGLSLAANSSKMKGVAYPVKGQVVKPILPILAPSVKVQSRILRVARYGIAPLKVPS